MRKLILMVLGTLLMALPASAQQQSVAEAARKAKAQKKATPPAKKVYTEENLPTSATSTEVGEKAATAAGEETVADPGKPAATGSDKGADEAAWRKRFAEHRGKIAQAEKELDILQRELNLISVQYYSDPNKALKEQLERTDINQHRKKIDDKKAEIAQLKQGLEDLERELRAAGGPPGWSRP